MKHTLVALALFVAAGFAYGQNEAPIYAQDENQTYTQDEDQTYARDQNSTYPQDEDQTYAPDQDQTYTQEEDQTYAQDEDQTLAPIIVPGVDVDRIIAECEPPNGAAECAQFHELIRQNFTPREIGMLFGGSTAYAEYRTSYDFTRERYLAFLQNLQDNGMPVPVSDQY